MKSLYCTALLLFCIISLSERANGIGHVRPRRHNAGTTDVFIAPLNCIVEKCREKFAQMIGSVQKHFSENDNLNINDEMMGELCDDRKAFKECVSDECTIPSDLQDLIDFFGFPGYLLCDSVYIDAIAKHGSCLITEMKRDEGAMLSGCTNMLAPVADHLKASVQLELGQQVSSDRLLTPPSESRRLRKRHSQHKGFSGLLANIRAAAAHVPAFTCRQVTDARDCLVQRAKNACDKDGKTEASDLANNVFKRFAERGFKAIKALNPSSDLIDLDVCFAENPLSFFFLF